jgi:hypothetical protein
MTDANYSKWLQKPEQAWKPVFAGRVMAELAMIAGASSIVPLVKSIAPERYDRLKLHLARQAILPNVDWLEKNIFQLPAFITTGRKLKETESKEEKSKLMADAIVDFCAMALAGVAGQVVGQTLSDRVAGLPDLVHPSTKGFVPRTLEQTRNMLKPVIFDKVVNMSVVGLMQFGMPQATTAVTDLTATGLQKTLGIPPEATQYFVQWYVPNIAGMGASGLMLSKKYTEFLKQMNHHGQGVA